MPTEAEWAEKISTAMANRPVPVVAQTYLGEWSTFSKPVKISCNDSRIYVVKGPQIGRAIVNEHVVGSLGQALDAPVGKIALVQVSAELITVEPKLGHIRPGLAHGTVFVQDCSERLGLDHTVVPENRERFSRLCILYSWMGASDHQFVYEKSQPNRVYSVDHGHFFGQNWTEGTLVATPPPQLDPVFQACSLTPVELKEATIRLEQITDDDIARAVGGPPDDWGASMQERIAMANYLWDRKNQLVQTLSATA